MSGPTADASKFTVSNADGAAYGESSGERIGADAWYEYARHSALQKNSLTSS